MSDRPLIFVSGLPRSGSTLMMNLLGQNPSHHVTPTSGLIHLMRHLLIQWPQVKEFRAAGLDAIKPSVQSAIRGMIYGFYEEPFAAGQTVFDKSRGWLHYVEPLEQILGRRVRIVTMVRDVRAIVASFEKIYRNRGLEYRHPSGLESPETFTAARRARHALRPDRVTGRSVLRVRDALARCRDRLVIVPYAHFTAHPQETMAAVHAALGLPAFTYDPQNVQQITSEDDSVNGMDLHSIRKAIEPSPPEPWRDYLPDKVSEKIAARYADLNELAAGPVVDYAADQ